MIESSNVVGPKLLQMLGVPSVGCTKAVIVLAVDQAVTVRATYLVNAVDDGHLIDLATEYRLFKLVELGDKT